MTNSFGNIVLAFFTNYLKDIKGLSENTIASYSDCMQILFSYASKKLNKHSVEDLNMEDITDELIIDFLNYLEKERNNQIQTRNQRLAIIKSFFSFIAGKCPTLIHVSEKIRSISFKKTEGKTINPLTDDELRIFFEGVENSETNRLRDVMIFRLLYNTGARVSELVNIKLSDISIEAPGQIKLQGKGNKERIACLFPETIESINDYLQFREDNKIKNEYLILNKHKGQIGRHGINYLVQKYADIASIENPKIKEKNVTPHTFRHTMAFHMIKAGVDIVTIKDKMGHEDINTTSKYIIIDNQMKQDALEKINPFKKSEAKPQWKQPEIMIILKNLSKKEAALC